MSDRPDAMELLAVARETLRDQVLPEVTGPARYQALMVANALGIALRELATQPHDDEAALRQLYGDSVPADEPPASLLRRLAGDIRRGEFDGALEHGLRRTLRARVEAELALSNPRRLRS